MDPPDREFPDACDLGAGRPGPMPTDREEQPIGEESRTDWLEEIVARLEDPDECGPAFESLGELDEEVRDQILAMLRSYCDRTGVRRLLGLFHTASDAHVGRIDTGNVTEEPGGRHLEGGEGNSIVHLVAPVPIEASMTSAVIPAGGTVREMAVVPALRAARIVRSLVTALDGEGVGMIMVSATDSGYRRTAAFRCDVRRGIVDVVGEVEEEHSSAGRLINEWIRQAETNYVVDAPGLTIRLLGAALLMSGPEIPDGVRSWLDATIGPGLPAAGSALVLPGAESDAIPADEMAARVGRVLDACPSWLDRSSLTYELAEEIAVREGGLTPDPVRDAGAYRYLFEHRLIRRLDLYARMLFWMGWFWQATGRGDLSRSAFALAGELSDEQHAVPSHPFTVTLTTRSLRAAQAQLRAWRVSGFPA